MKQLSLLLIVTCTISCNGNEPSSQRNDTVIEETKVTTHKSPDVICFSTTGTDTVILRINISDSLVSGTLIYKLYEKDSNKGKLEGKLYGDTLIADYKFISEGIESIRQVAFLIKDSMAIEGYGDIEQKDGKTVFKNLKSLDFTHGLPLTKVDCK